MEVIFQQKVASVGKNFRANLRKNKNKMLEKPPLDMDDKWAQRQCLRPEPIVYVRLFLAEKRNAVQWTRPKRQNNKKLKEDAFLRETEMIHVGLICE